MTATFSFGPARSTASRYSGKVSNVHGMPTNSGAVAGVDYVTTTGTLTFGPNETAKNIVIPLLNAAAHGNGGQWFFHCE